MRDGRSVPGSLGLSKVPDKALPFPLPPSLWPLSVHRWPKPSWKEFRDDEIPKKSIASYSA